MNNGEKYLPIGTVVLLKGGKKELMITCYSITPNGEVYDQNGKVEMKDKTFDYGGCFYPEGIINSNQTFAFNHEQIDKICYLGYVTDNSKELSKILVENASKVDSIV